MTDEAADAIPPPVRTPTTAPQRHRYKRHEVALANGGRLVLDVDGTIEHVDGEGTVARAWSPDDPEWPDQAIRFGLHPQAPTVAPQGRRAMEGKPPRW